MCKQGLRKTTLTVTVNKAESFLLILTALEFKLEHLSVVRNASLRDVAFTQYNDRQQNKYVS